MRPSRGDYGRGVPPPKKKKTPAPDFSREAKAVAKSTPTTHYSKPGTLAHSYTVDAGGTGGTPAVAGPPAPKPPTKTALLNSAIAAEKNSIRPKSIFDEDVQKRSDKRVTERDRKQMAAEYIKDKSQKLAEEHVAKMEDIVEKRDVPVPKKGVTLNQAMKRRQRLDKVLKKVKNENKANELEAKWIRNNLRLKVNKEKNILEVVTKKQDVVVGRQPVKYKTTKKLYDEGIKNMMEEAKNIRAGRGVFRQKPEEQGFLSKVADKVGDVAGDIQAGQRIFEPPHQEPVREAATEVADKAAMGFARAVSRGDARVPGQTMTAGPQLGLPNVDFSKGGFNAAMDVLVRPSDAVLAAVGKSLVRDGLIKGDMAERIKKAPGFTEALTTPRDQTEGAYERVSGGNILRGVTGKKEAENWGLVLDILLDPITYVGAGAAPALKGTKAIMIAKRLQKAGVQVDKDAATRLASEAARSQNFDDYEAFLRKLADDGGVDLKRLGLTKADRAIKRDIKKAATTRSKKKQQEILNRAKAFRDDAEEIGGKKMNVPAAEMIDSLVEGVRLANVQATRPGIELRLLTPLGNRVGGVTVPIWNKMPDFTSGLRLRESRVIGRPDTTDRQRLNEIREERLQAEVNKEFAKEIRIATRNLENVRLMPNTGPTAKQRLKDAEEVLESLETQRAMRVAQRRDELAKRGRRNLGEKHEMRNRQRAQHRANANANTIERQVRQDFLDQLDEALTIKTKIKENGKEGIRHSPIRPEEALRVTLFQTARADTGGYGFLADALGAPTARERKAIRELDALYTNFRKTDVAAGTLDRWIADYVPRQWRIGDTDVTTNVFDEARKIDGKAKYSKARSAAEMASIADRHELADSLRKLTAGKRAALDMDEALKLADQWHSSGRVRTTTEQLAGRIQRGARVHIDELTEAEKDAYRWFGKTDASTKHIGTMKKEGDAHLFEVTDEGMVRLADDAMENFGFDPNLYDSVPHFDATSRKISAAKHYRSTLRERLKNVDSASLRGDYIVMNLRLKEEIKALEDELRAAGRDRVEYTRLLPKEQRLAAANALRRRRIKNERRAGMKERRTARRRQTKSVVEADAIKARNWFHGSPYFGLTELRAGIAGQDAIGHGVYLTSHTPSARVYSRTNQVGEDGAGITGPNKFEPLLKAEGQASIYELDVQNIRGVVNLDAAVDEDYLTAVDNMFVEYGDLIDAHEMMPGDLGDLRAQIDDAQEQWDKFKSSPKADTNGKVWYRIKTLMQSIPDLGVDADDLYWNKVLNKEMADLELDGLVYRERAYSAGTNEGSVLVLTNPDFESVAQITREAISGGRLFNKLGPHHLPIHEVPLGTRESFVREMDEGLIPGASKEFVDNLKDFRLDHPGFAPILDPRKLAFYRASASARAAAHMARFRSVDDIHGIDLKNADRSFTAQAAKPPPSEAELAAQASFDKAMDELDDFRTSVKEMVEARGKALSPGNEARLGKQEQSLLERAESYKAAWDEQVQLTQKDRAVFKGHVSELRRTDDGYIHIESGTRFDAADVKMQEGSLVRRGPDRWVDVDTGREYQMAPEAINPRVGEKDALEEMANLGIGKNFEGRLWPIDVTRDLSLEMMRAGEFYTNKAYTNGVTQLMRQYLKTTRFGVTTYFPAYHVRNMISDVLLSLQADSGVLFHPLSVAKAIGVSMFGKGGKIKLKGYDAMNAEDFMLVAHLWGFKSGQHAADILVLNERQLLATSRGGATREWLKGGMGFGPSKKFGQAAGDFSTRRENIMRFITFQQRLRANGGDAADATWHTIKHHFDYNDLAGWEREWARNLFLFYTWYRKNIPLQFTQMIERPGFFTSINHSYQNTMAGTAPWSRNWSEIHPLLPNTSEPVPGTGLIPNYMYDLGAITQTWNESTLVLGFGAPWADVNFVLSPIQAGQEGGVGAGFQDLFQNVTTLLNPPLQVAAKLGSNIDMLTGRQYKYEETSGMAEGLNWLTSKFGVDLNKDDDGAPLLPSWANNMLGGLVPAIGRGTSPLNPSDAADDQGFVGKFVVGMLGPIIFGTSGRVISHKGERFERLVYKKLNERMFMRGDVSERYRNAEQKKRKTKDGKIEWYRPRQEAALKEFDKETMKFIRSQPKKGIWLKHARAFGASLHPKFDRTKKGTPVASSVDIMDPMAAIEKMMNPGEPEEKETAPARNAAEEHDARLEEDANPEQEEEELNILTGGINLSWGSTPSTPVPEPSEEDINKHFKKAELIASGAYDRMAKRGMRKEEERAVKEAPVHKDTKLPSGKKVTRKQKMALAKKILRLRATGHGNPRALMKASVPSSGQSFGLAPGHLNEEQARIMTTILSVGDSMGATDKEKLAAVETAIIESGITNPDVATDHDSLGWRQERQMYYDNPTNVEESAQRFFEEAREADQDGISAGALAQAAQQSAYPEKYDAIEGQARPLLAAYEKSKRANKPKVKAKIKKLTEQGKEWGIFKVPDGPANAPFAYPLAKSGQVGGGPDVHGARAFGNWMSDNAVDIMVPENTPVRAVKDAVVTGVVESARNPGGNPAGSTIYLRDANGEEYSYMHLNDVSVTQGQKVTQGENIGKSGIANNSAHLHFATMNKNPVNVVEKARIKRAAKGPFVDFSPKGPGSTSRPNIFAGDSGGDTSLRFQRPFAKALIKLARASGEPLQINEGTRSFARQTELYNNPALRSGPAAVPGTSNHEGGAAIDVELTPTQEGLLSKFGLSNQVVSGEPWHVELVDGPGAGKIMSTAEAKEAGIDKVKPGTGNINAGSGMSIFQQAKAQMYPDATTSGGPSGGGGGGDGQTYDTPGGGENTQDNVGTDRPLTPLELLERDDMLKSELEGEGEDYEQPLFPHLRKSRVGPSLGLQQEIDRLRSLR